MSAVGSASAYPSSVAKSSASWNSIPSWVIFVRMKFVVPFTIPMTSVIWFPARHCFNGRIIGIPPATAASNRKSTLCSCAVSRSSFPATATKSLFAVTTCLPASKAWVMYSFAGDKPPISSITKSICGSLTMLSQSLVRIEESSTFFAAFSRLRTRIFTIFTSQPSLCIISVS